MGEQKNRESFPYLEGNSYSSFSNQPSVDYPSSYQESYSLPPPRTSPRPTPNLGLSEDVMDNSLIEFKKYHVGVDTRDGLTLGMTVRDGRHHFIWENLPLLDVAVHADYKKFLNMILETV